MITLTHQITDSVCLVYIPKVQVLAIGHIAKRCCIEISAVETAFHRALDLVPPLVLSCKHEAQDQDQYHFDQMADDHAPDAQRVLWRLVGEVEEWANDVAGTVAEEEDGVRDDFLRVACRVCRAHRKDHDELKAMGVRVSWCHR